MQVFSLIKLNFYISFVRYNDRTCLCCVAIDGVLKKETYSLLSYVLCLLCPMVVHENGLFQVADGLNTNGDLA